MALLTKPNMQQIWASGGDIVEPSDLKKQQGWTVEVPPHQFENWIQNRQDEYLAHINQRGIPAWDATTEYAAGGLSYVQGSDGVVYKSVAASGPSTTTQDPTTDVTDIYWEVAFTLTTQATETVQGIVELATTVEAEAGLDDERAMTPLKVKQAIEQFAGGDLLNRATVTIAAAPTINLTAGAPDTSQLEITGTGVSISGFTVAADRAFIVKFSGENTLVNSAAVTTNTGANIITASGDSAIIRATASNVVEVLYLKARVASQSSVNAGADDFRAVTPLKLKSGFSINLATTGHIKFPAWLGGIQICWGQSNLSGTSTTPVTFDRAFSSVYQVVGFRDLAGTANTSSLNSTALSNTGFSQVNTGSQPCIGRYIAIGEG